MGHDDRVPTETAEDEGFGVDEDLLIDFRWATGRMLRDISVSLDDGSKNAGKASDLATMARRVAEVTSLRWSLTPPINSIRRAPDWVVLANCE